MYGFGSFSGKFQANAFFLRFLDFFEGCALESVARCPWSVGDLQRLDAWKGGANRDAKAYWGCVNGFVPAACSSRTRACSPGQTGPKGAPLCDAWDHPSNSPNPATSGLDLKGEARFTGRRRPHRAIPVRSGCLLLAWFLHAAVGVAIDAAKAFRATTPMP